MIKVNRKVNELTVIQTGEQVTVNIYFNFRFEETRAVRVVRLRTEADTVAIWGKAAGESD